MKKVHSPYENIDRDVLLPCPYCLSEDITVTGSAWIQVVCDTCEFQGKAHSYGSRLARYRKAIQSWNMGEENESH